MAGTRSGSSPSGPGGGRASRGGGGTARGPRNLRAAGSPTDGPGTDPLGRLATGTLVAGPCLVAAAAVSVGGGDPIALAGTTAAAAGLCLLWFGAAWGFGWLVLAGWAELIRADDRGRVRDAATRSLLTIAVGAAILLALAGGLFRLSATPAAAWGLTVVGWLGTAAWGWRRWSGARAAGPDGAAERSGRRRLGPADLPWTIAVAVVLGIGLAAAASAPGWLWRSEFGGYDVLSYHLQLPAEWMAAGRASPLPHNVYASLPNAVEYAFLHLGLLRGDAVAAAPAAQLLHLVATGLAALTIAHIVRGLGGARASNGTLDASGAAGAADATSAGAIAAGLAALATPWLVVVGSLAYNEGVVLWLGAAVMLWAIDRGRARAAKSQPSSPPSPPSPSAPPGRDTARRDVIEGAGLGLLVGGVVAAKLSAGPLLAVPLGLWWLIHRRPRVATVMRVGVATGVVALLVLSPWLAGNARAFGNPVFPFATGFLGAGPWTPEQVAAWQLGHRAGGDVSQLWTAWLAHGVDGSMPPQWGLLPWLGLVALAVGVVRARARATSIALAALLATQLVAWLLLTHAQSRFLIPTVLPLAIAVGALVSSFGAGGGRGEARRDDGARRGPAHGSAAGRLVIGFVALAASIWPAAIWMGERADEHGRGRPALAVGALGAFTGDDFAVAIREAERAGDRGGARAWRESAPPAYWINHELAESSRVLFVGQAEPFYVRDVDRITYQTVWDRGPMSDWLAAIDPSDTPDDARGGAAADRIEPARPGRPSWVDAARADGYTHVLLDRAMLDNWADRGWGDPALRVERILTEAGDELAVLADFPSRGETLYVITADRARSED